MGDQDHGDTDILGACGELAFCKLANVYPDMTVSPRQGGVDCTMPSGTTVDVKTIRSARHNLLKRPSKGECADVFVLMLRATEYEYTYLGYATKSELVQPGRLTDLSHGPTYLVGQQELHPQLPT